MRLKDRCRCRYRQFLMSLRTPRLGGSVQIPHKELGFKYPKAGHLVGPGYLYLLGKCTHQPVASRRTLFTNLYLPGK